MTMKWSAFLVNLGICVEIVENCSKWLEMSELKRFRHAQIDSETLRKIWIFDRDLTRICQRRVSPSIDFEHVKSGKGWVFPGEPGLLLADHMVAPLLCDLISLTTNQQQTWWGFLAV